MIRCHRNLQLQTMPTVEYITLWQAWHISELDSAWNCGARCTRRCVVAKCLVEILLIHATPFRQCRLSKLYVASVSGHFLWASDCFCHTVKLSDLKNPVISTVTLRWNTWIQYARHPCNLHKELCQVMRRWGPIFQYRNDFWYVAVEDAWLLLCDEDKNWTPVREGLRMLRLLLLSPLGVLLLTDGDAHSIRTFEIQRRIVSSWKVRLCKKYISWYTVHGQAFFCVSIGLIRVLWLVHSRDEVLVSVISFPPPHAPFHPRRPCRRHFLCRKLSKMCTVTTWTFVTCW